MQPALGRTARTGVVIPIRAFRAGNARLAEILDDEARFRLASTMAERVVAAATPLPVLIVSSATEVLSWAHERHLATIPDPGTGLDGAVAAGRAELATRGFDHLIVAHADLPRASARSLARFAVPEAIVTIVPCHRDDGTPVLALPTGTEFAFGYGPGSARRHAAEARRVGLAVRLVRDPDLGYDVDVPADLAGSALT